MREAAFRAFMEHDRVRFSNPDSIDSYLSGCRQVERRGRVDLDDAFDHDGLAGVLGRIDAALDAGGGGNWPAPKTLRNYRSHIEAYAEFRADIG